MIIAISGTPGAGKTYIAKKLSKATGGKLEYFDLNKYIRDNKLYDSYDKKDKTYEVDIKRLKADVGPTLKRNMSMDAKIDKMAGKTFKSGQFVKIFPKNSEGILVDSHLSHHLESDYCIIVRTDIKTLNKRLKARKYPKSKIRDNVESEIFEICLDEARRLKRKVIVVEN